MCDEDAIVNSFLVNMISKAPSMGHLQLLKFMLFD